MPMRFCVVGPTRATRLSVRARPVNETGRNLLRPEAPRVLTIKPEGGKVAADPASMTAQGPRHAEVTTFNFNYELSSHLNITSGSMALAPLSQVLLVTGWWRGRKPAPAVVPLAIGEGAD
jgi:hypothetical protein